MRDFKFLSKNDTINFNGQMSIEALRYFNDYINRIVRYEITTTTATYKIVDYTYGEGNVVAGTVNAYPLVDNPNLVVTYTIRGGEITGYTIHLDYWNTMEQLANAIRRED
jgi:hypothetical protein